MFGRCPPKEPTKKLHEPYSQLEFGALSRWVWDFRCHARSIVLHCAGPSAREGRPRPENAAGHAEHQGCADQNEVRRGPKRSVGTDQQGAGLNYFEADAFI